jgi:hypothetical protein
MVQVFSFCLYGPHNDMYYTGMLQNIYLASTFFPEWKVYVYVGSDVTQAMRDTLATCANVCIRETGVTGSINMIYRFFAIDEPNVELMMVRDADSRIHWKDRWAIRQFVCQPQYHGHVIRDNKVHNVRMMGGLWGLRKASGIHVRTEYDEFVKYPRDHGAGYDQSFLAERIYPRILGRLLVHHSYGLVYPAETGFEFPFAWTSEVFCGRPEFMYVERPEPQQELRAKKESFKLFYSK